MVLPPQESGVVMTATMVLNDGLTSFYIKTLPFNLQCYVFRYFSLFHHFFIFRAAEYL